MTTRTVEGLIEEAVAKVIEERPQLGPFTSYLRRCVPIRRVQHDWDREKVAESDQEDWNKYLQYLTRSVALEADELEQVLDNRALLVLLVGVRDGSKPVPYREAVVIDHLLAYLDQEDIEPACKAFIERVEFHRMMRAADSEVES